MSVLVELGLTFLALALFSYRQARITMLPTDRTRVRGDAEDRFSIKVDVPVPTDGKPWPFAEMLTR